jgi:hypothetical protein
MRSLKLVDEDQHKLAAIIKILVLEWHPNYIAQIVNRYYRRAPLADAMRAVALCYTHPGVAVSHGELAKKRREHVKQ